MSAGNGRIPGRIEQLEHQMLRLRIRVREELGELVEKLHALAGHAEAGSPSALLKLSRALRALGNRISDFREELKRPEKDPYETDDDADTEDM